ncbi:MAG: RNA polymerase sigma factor [Bryobacter sp.]|nr:RNA polymerase sigma factor [Bryobacter sp.]
MELVASLKATAQPDFAERIRQGERAALREAYERTHQRLYRFALAMSGDPEAAADALQETFVALLREPGQFDPHKGSLEAFLYGILRNRLREWRRKKAGGEVPWEEEEQSELGQETLLEGLSRKSRNEAVRAAILALPEHYREVVTLVELEEMTYEESAAVLGLPVGTVRSRLSRARGHLEKSLRELSLREGSAR